MGVKEIHLVKTQNGSFLPASTMDQEIAGKWKVGQPIRFKAVKVSQRSLQHHKLYWGGLLGLAIDYWEPEGGLISASEKHTLSQFSSWLDSKSGGSGSIQRACEAFMVELAASRAEKIDAPEKDIEQLHKWIKVEAGYFTYVITPHGIRKEPASINFNAMSQDQFNDFYRAAFSVVWKFILSRTFEDEVAAEQAINQLVAMG
jgi:hypothetical protein